MKTKEIIWTEYDDRGRMIKRTSTVEVFETEEDRERDIVAEISGIHRASTKRIQEAIDDYRMSRDW